MDAADQREYQKRRLVDATTPNANRVAEVLGLDTNDELVRIALTQLCMRMFYAGFEVGYAEILAQVREQGGDFTLNVERPLFDDTGPLSD